MESIKTKTEKQGGQRITWVVHTDAGEPHEHVRTEQAEGGELKIKTGLNMMKTILVKMEK